jgi:lysophospholipase L1-like esterase
VFLTVPPINADNIKEAFDQPTAFGWREEVDTVNEYVRSQVHIDITEGMEDERGNLRTDLALDGLHPDPPGKRMMAEAINAAWPDIIALPDSTWNK